MNILTHSGAVLVWNIEMSAVQNIKDLHQLDEVSNHEYRDYVHLY